MPGKAGGHPRLTSIRMALAGRIFGDIANLATRISTGMGVNFGKYTEKGATALGLRK